MRTVREVDLAGEQLALLADVLDRVQREFRERLVDPLALALELLGRDLEVDHAPGREQLSAAAHLAAGDRRPRRRR